MKDGLTLSLFPNLIYPSFSPPYSLSSSRRLRRGGSGGSRGDSSRAGPTQLAGQKSTQGYVEETFKGFPRERGKVRKEEDHQLFPFLLITLIAQLIPYKISCNGWIGLFPCRELIAAELRQASEWQQQQSIGGSIANMLWG
jgi:hypothetical protein